MYVYVRACINQKISRHVIPVQMYWKDKPVLVENQDQKEEVIQQILDLESLEQSMKHVEKFDNLNFDKTEYSKEILDFVNEHYNGSKYSEALLSYYMENGGVAIKCHKKDKILGIIIGKPITIVFNECEYNVIEINFLIVAKPLRKLGFAETLITRITLEAIKMGIGMAYYTIAQDIIGKPHFCKQSPINIPVCLKRLFENGFFDFGNVTDPQTALKSIFQNSTGIINETTVYTPKKFYNCRIINGTAQNSTNTELITRFLDRSRNRGYKMYKKFSESEMQSLFKNKDMFHYVFYRGKDIVGYMCFFKLAHSNGFINGHLYFDAWETGVDADADHDQEDMVIFAYNVIKKQKTFDNIVVNMSDTRLFKSFNYISGRYQLYMYLFNAKIGHLDPSTVSMTMC